MGLVPVEEASVHPTRCEMEERSHLCAICSSLCVGKERYISVGFWSLAGPSCQEHPVDWDVRGLFHVCARQDHECAYRLVWKGVYSV
eukprot:11862543-Ditylum_brightwellii.AAC.1